MEQDATTVAALAFYALHVADPALCYDALRATNPASDWDAWIEKCEQMRRDMRQLQSEPEGVPALLDVMP